METEAPCTLFESVSSLCLSTCLIKKTVKFKSDTVVMGKVLGEGAFSFVYTAISPYKQKKYALKKVYLNSSEYEKIVEAELFSFREFHHKNILQLLDHTYTKGRKGRSICMLFPLIPQGSMRQTLDRYLSSSVLDKSPSSTRILVVLKQFVSICSAIQVLHGFLPSYVHQDIKPEVSDKLLSVTIYPDFSLEYSDEKQWGAAPH